MQMAGILLRGPRKREDGGCQQAGRTIETAPFPVYLMPGTIMVPVDNSDALLTDLDDIVKEARTTGSRVGW